MKLLDRYVLRGFVVNYFIALAVMIGVYVVTDLFFNLDEFYKDASETRIDVVRNILDYYGYNMLLYFAQLAGVITVVAACCTLAKMHRANELTAVLASGTSLYRIAWPVVLAGVVMNCIWFVDQEFVIPRVADKLARPHSDIKGATIYPVWFLPERSHNLVSARAFHPGSGAIQGLVVMHRDDRGHMTGITRADLAQWDPDRHVWALTYGIEETFVSGESGDAANTAGRRSVDVYAGELTPEDVLVQQASQWTTFLSLMDLSRYQARYANDATFVKAKHARIITPLVGMILLLLGVPFFLTRERVSILAAGLRCILLCGACFVLAFIGQNVDFSGLGAGPALPVWIPVLVFGPIAVLVIDGVKT